MNPLASMAKTVLLGTEKRPPPRPTADGDVGDLLESLPQDEVERAVLRGAAVLATCQSAGWLPPVVEEATEAAPVEADSEPLPPAIHQTLAAILADGPPRLQAESFRLLASRGRTLPHRLLPKALHLGRAQAALRPFLLPVLGARGDWLARRNSDWGFSVGGTGADTHDENWEHGSLDQRKAALTKIRSLTPARARDLAAAVMKTEAARERAAFLEILGDGLSPADQDLLESALADKSKEVRLTAARLLSTLPDSPLARRMTARLADCLHVEKKFLRGLTAQITPPAAFGANWAQDTLEEAVPAGVRIGQRAWWLLQLVKYSPLGWWESVAPWSPSEWWKWAEKSEWKDALWQGWSTALRWQRNTAWAEAILSHDPSAARRPEMLDLLEAIPLPKRESLFLRLLGAAPVDSGHTLSTMTDRFLATLPLAGTSLSPAAALPLVRLLRDRIDAGAARFDWPLRATLVELACVVTPPCYDALSSGWDPSRPEHQPLSEGLARLEAVLDHRRRLQACFPAS